MFSFLWNKAKDKEINQLIFDVAEYNKVTDQKELFRRMKDLELYSSVVKANFDIENGKLVHIEEGMQLAITSVNMGNSKVALFFVNKNDARLASQFIALTCIEVFNIVEKSSDLDGFVFYNHQQSYFGVPKSSFPSIRKTYGLY